ncbi:hypothetical protein DM02DRAFT_665377, partial [Periconia macrospinosa]
QGWAPADETRYTSSALAIARLLLSQPARPASKPRSVCATAIVQLRVITLFKDIRAGMHPKQQTEIKFQLVEREYDDIESQLTRDEVLLGYVEDKIQCVRSRSDRAAS